MKKGSHGLSSTDLQVLNDAGILNGSVPGQRHVEQMESV